jgi:hypothetical protein
MQVGKPQQFQRPRTTVFLWPTREHLYKHFEMTYNLSREEIDEAIEEAMKGFRLRQGKPVESKELWQKTGLMLKRKLLR